MEKLAHLIAFVAVGAIGVVMMAAGGYHNNPDAIAYIGFVVIGMSFTVFLENLTGTKLGWYGLRHLMQIAITAFSALWVVTGGIGEYNVTGQTGYLVACLVLAALAIGMAFVSETIAAIKRQPVVR